MYGAGRAENRAPRPLRTLRIDVVPVGLAVRRVGCSDAERAGFAGQRREFTRELRKTDRKSVV
jgi:hypothetical protein